MVRHITCAFLALTIAPPLCFARTKETKEQQQEPSTMNRREKEKTQRASFDVMLPAYEPLSDPRPPVEIPLSAGAWVVEVETIGGLTGSRKGYILLTSEGDFTADDSKLYRRLDLSDELGEIDRLIKQAKPSEWSTSKTDVQTVSICQECYKTNLTLYRRESDNTKRGYRVAWDETTAGRLIKEVGDIFGAIERLKQGALQPYKKGLGRGPS